MSVKFKLKIFWIFNAKETLLFTVKIIRCKFISKQTNNKVVWLCLTLGKQLWLITYFLFSGDDDEEQKKSLKYS